MQKNVKSIIALTILIFTSIACSLGQAANPKLTQPAMPTGNIQVPDATVQAPPNIIIIPTATTIPTNPIGLRQGLSSLNSYRLTIQMKNNGPSELDKSESSFTVESGSDGNSTHIKNISTNSSEENPEMETSETDQYIFDNHQCSYPKDSEIEKSDMDPMVKEVFDAWYGLLDLVPTVNDPKFVNSEELNGIMTNHFKFDVRGLGAKSGAEVISSNGEYWLAQDGQYIVKYQVLIETRNGPMGDNKTKSVHSEFLIEVSDINQNIVIDIPANCK